MNEIIVALITGGVALRPMIEQAAKSFTDAEATKSPELVARCAVFAA